MSERHMSRLFKAHAVSKAVREGSEVTCDGKSGTVLGIDNHGMHPMVSVRLDDGGVRAVGLGDVRPRRRRA